MDTAVKTSEALVFHLSGRVAGAMLRPVAGAGLRPALLAPYRDLDALRHDFPVVLTPAASGSCVQTLSSLVDRMLRDVAPRGIEGERLRRHALQLEREIRAAVGAGARGTLGELWDAAAARLGAREGETLEQVLQHAGGALHADGDVLGCTAAMPAALLRHAWTAARDAKAARFRADASRLTQKLSDILRAARAHSVEGLQPQSLRASLGAPHQAQFDFERLSRIVAKGARADELPPARRERLESALSTIERQRFFADRAGDDGDAEAGSGHGFVYDNCAAAAQAFRERLPEAAALIKALAVAELEAKGAYHEAEHDPVFEAFGAHSLTATDLARLPDYLVCIPADRNEAAENANLMAMLSSGMPVKVLVLTSDLAEEAAIGGGQFAFGVRSARLATTAMGLGGMFVLQAAASSLVAMRERIAAGLASAAPALFSVFVADGSQGLTVLPPYLVAATATQSRAFASFSYDAAAGLTWATRFSLAHNPQPELDWPLEELDIADATMQRQRLQLAFTYADFALGDRRFSRHFALVEPAAWNDDEMVPLDAWLERSEADAARRVPFLWAVDGEDRLQRVLVDARLAQATGRCLLLWRRLQEHGGVNEARAARAAAAVIAV
jgi:hypothetical protein